MSVDPHSERAPRARPVADAPVEALLALADELARRWAIALILARPLAEMAEIPLEDLAHEAPALCAQLARALSSDAELERIAADADVARGEGHTPGRRLRLLTGARDASVAVGEVEALRGVLWEASLRELSDPPARLVADLCDRLALVCATALAAMLASPTSSTQDAPRAAPVAHEQGLQGAAGRRGSVVIVDEREDVPARRGAASRRSANSERRGPAVDAGVFGVRSRSSAEHQPSPDPPRTDGRPLPWDTPLRDERLQAPPVQADAASTVPPASTPTGGDPVMRVTRGGSPPADEPA